MKRRINVALSRATGYELRRVGGGATHRGGGVEPRAGDRLLVAPAFVLCSVRSGSTLLRVLLDSHSQICAPHELHLAHLRVKARKDFAVRSLAEAGLDERGLEYLLWDRLLHRELSASGKRLLVNKTPSDVFVADRIRECWPDARFIFLLRHPAAIARSRAAARPQDAEERNLHMVLRYCEAIEAARRTHDGLTVRYEELAADAERETRRVCDFLGVGWERQMLDYGRFEHGRMKPGLGDWSPNIKSGRVQAPKPLPRPDEVPEALRALAGAWGYLPDRAAVT